MSIVDLGQYKGDVEDMPEIAPAEADSEVKVRIIDCKTDVDKNGNPYLLATLEIPDDIGAPEFTKFLGFPTSDMTERQKFKKLRALEMFGEAFDIDVFSPFDPKDLVGQEAYALVGIEKNDEFGDKNYIKKFITGA